MADARLLSEVDSALLKRIIQKEVRRELASRGLTRDDDEGDSQDIYIAKVPSASDSIPARSGTTAGSLDCDIYKIDITDASIDAVTDIQRKVYNPYGCKLYKAAHPYFEIRRTKHGLWVCDKPRMFHKGKVTVVGDPYTVELWFNGVASTLTESVYLNWLSDEAITVGKEVTIKFYEDENKWTFDDAECETT